MSTLQIYIGTKIIQATPQQHADGRDGYQVVYGDSYTSWSPKDVLWSASTTRVSRLRTMGAVSHLLACLHAGEA